ncbi:conserved protein, unknown function [Hepatocystis sp. ex Piliocolobus tephrosceles]|nr:conserved protein, unknown function [Hepatocystis sp. ex Piliocolobus tephrosceles]
MTYGCGTVALPFIGRALVFFLSIEAAYCTYDLFAKPLAIYSYYGITNMLNKEKKK